MAKENYSKFAGIGNNTITSSTDIEPDPILAGLDRIVADRELVNHNFEMPEIEDFSHLYNGPADPSDGVMTPVALQELSAYLDEKQKKDPAGVLKADILHAKKNRPDDYARYMANVNLSGRDSAFTSARDRMFLAGEYRSVGLNEAANRELMASAPEWITATFDKDWIFTQIASDEIGAAESFKRQPISEHLEKVPVTGLSTGAANAVQLQESIRRLQNPEVSYKPAKKRKRVGDEDYNILENISPAALFAGPNGPSLRVMSDPAVNLAGEDLKEYDSQLVLGWLTRQAEQTIRGTTPGADISQGISELPAFMIEFAASGGLANIIKSSLKSGGKKIFKEATEEGTEQLIKKGILNNIKKGGIKTLKTAGDVALRMPMFTGDVVAGATERQLPEFSLTDKGITIYKEGEKPATAWLKAIGDTYIELFTENSSELTTSALKQGGKWIGNILGKAPGGETAGKILTGLGEAYNKIRPKGAFADIITDKAKYGSFLEELGEEKLGAILRAATGVEDFGAGDDANFSQRMAAAFDNMTDGRTMLVEMGVLAAPGVARSGVQGTLNKIDNVQKDKTALKAMQQRDTPQAVETIINRMVQADGDDGRWQQISTRDRKTAEKLRSILQPVTDMITEESGGAKAWRYAVQPTPNGRWLLKMRQNPLDVDKASESKATVISANNPVPLEDLVTGMDSRQVQELVDLGLTVDEIADKDTVEKAQYDRQWQDMQQPGEFSQQDIAGKLPKTIEQYDVNARYNMPQRHNSIGDRQISEEDEVRIQEAVNKIGKTAYVRVDDEGKLVLSRRKPAKDETEYIEVRPSTAHLSESIITDDGPSDTKLKPDDTATIQRLADSGAEYEELTDPKKAKEAHWRSQWSKHYKPGNFTEQELVGKPAAGMPMQGEKKQENIEETSQSENIEQKPDAKEKAPENETEETDPIQTEIDKLEKEIFYEQMTDKISPAAQQSIQNTQDRIKELKQQQSENQSVETPVPEPEKIEEKPSESDSRVELKQLIDSYDEDVNTTIGDLIDEAEILADDTEDTELQQIVEKVRAEQHDDRFEFGLRGDSEAYEGEFEDAVRKLIDNQSAETIESDQNKSKDEAKNPAAFSEGDYVADVNSGTIYKVGKTKRNGVTDMEVVKPKPERSASNIPYTDEQMKKAYSPGTIRPYNALNNPRFREITEGERKEIASETAPKPAEKPSKTETKPKQQNTSESDNTTIQPEKQQSGKVDQVQIANKAPRFDCDKIVNGKSVTEKTRDKYAGQIGELLGRKLTGDERSLLSFPTDYTLTPKAGDDFLWMMVKSPKAFAANARKSASEELIERHGITRFESEIKPVSPVDTPKQLTNAVFTHASTGVEGRYSLRESFYVDPDDNTVVSTDGRRLIAVTGIQDRIGNPQSDTLYRKDSSSTSGYSPDTTGGKFPKWRTAIPNNTNKISTLDNTRIHRLLSVLTGTIKHNPGSFNNKVIAIFAHNGQAVGFSADNMVDSLTAMLKTGIDKVDFAIGDKSRSDGEEPLVITGSDKTGKVSAKVIIMRYTLSGAKNSYLDISDLLGTEFVTDEMFEGKTTESKEKKQPKAEKTGKSEYGFGTFDSDLSDDHTGGYYKYLPGKSMKTATGRKTKPVPRVDTTTRQKTKNSQKRINTWLISEALVEAKSRNDEHNIRVFEMDRKTGADKLPPAQLDMLQYYLFDPKWTELHKKQPINKEEEKSEQKEQPKPESQEPANSDTKQTVKSESDPYAEYEQSASSYNYGEGRSASQEVIFKGGAVRWEDDRIRVYFDEKPSDQIRKQLKSIAFKWAPSKSAWQVHYMQQHRFDKAVRILESVFDRADTNSAEVEKNAQSEPVVRHNYTTDNQFARPDVNTGQGDFSKELHTYAKTFVSWLDSLPNGRNTNPGEITKAVKNSPVSSWVKVRNVTTSTFPYQLHFLDKEGNTDLKISETTAAKMYQEVINKAESQTDNSNTTHFAEKTKSNHKETIDVTQMEEQELADYIARKGKLKGTKSAGIKSKISDKAVDELNDAFDELKDYLKGRSFVNPMMEPKLWELTAKITAKAIKAGIYKFADLVRYSVNKLDIAHTKLLGPLYESAWDDLAEVDTSGKMEKRDSSVEKILDSESAKGDNDNRKGNDNDTESGIHNRDGIGKTGVATPERPLSEPSGDAKSTRSGSSDQVVRGDGQRSGRVDGSGDKRQGKSNAVSTGSGNIKRDLDNTTRSGRSGPAGRNYRIEPGQDIAGRGTKTRAKNNIAAIRLLNKLEEENRLATAEEQEVLVKYTGWGDKPQIFDESNSEWSDLYNELKELLTDKQYSAARRSTLNAHYTSTEVIGGIWNGLKSLGIAPVRVMEPSMGTGHFYGAMPEGINADLYGVELDDITGNIAKNLYQKANIKIIGYEKVRFPENFFDLHISNVPFGEYKLSDHNITGRDKYLIHDFFFVKALHNTRPGGIVAFITSKGTLDKLDSSVREELAKTADLVGAVRLPYTAFKGNAGTEVVTDIIILQKRLPDQSPAGEDFTEIAEIEQDVDIFKVNEYYQNHPDHILGKLAYTGKMYREKSLNVEPVEGQELGRAIADTIGVMKLPIGFNDHIDQKTKDLESPKGKGLVPENIKYNAFTIQDGIVYQNANGDLKQVTRTVKDKKEPLSKKMVSRYRKMIAVRDTALNLLSEQLDETVTDEKVEQTRRELNRAYDDFVKEFKPFSTNYNAGQFRHDPDYPLLRSLEHYDSETQTAEKAAVFSQRTQRPVKILSKVETAKDGLLACYDKYGKVDIDYVAELTGKDTQDVIDELIGLIYKDPDTGSYISAENYLSGNVRDKLSKAQEAAQDDPDYKINVEALEEVQPEDLEPHDIDVKLGSNWVAPEDYQQFIMKILDRPSHFPVTIAYSVSGGSWILRGNKLSNAIETQQWGTSRRSALDILEATLNQRRMKIYDTVKIEGKEVKVLNKEDSLAAQAKQEEFERAFKEWIWSDDDRRERLARKYNDLYNNTIFAQYDGSHLSFPGQNIAITLNPHQKNVVWRSLQQGNILLAHATGAGKTFVMASVVMESRRLGLARKPVVVVPNHLVDDFSGQLFTLYPSAKVLRATKKDFTPASRQTLFNRIRTGDWDAVVVPMSSFEKMPMNPEYTEKVFSDMLDDLEDEIRAAKAEKNDNRSIVKQLENAKEKFKATLETLESKHKKDNGPYFDELGIDKMFVDEAHGYKNLWFKTQKQDIAGISPQYVQRAFDMWLKTQFLNDRTNYKGVVFATATPIANSVTEMFIMQKYLQPQILADRGVSSFDAWSTNFGKTVVQSEVTPDGAGYRMKERFSQFSNIPELMQMFRSVADIVTSDMLNLPVPKLKDGKHQVVQAPENEYLKYFVDYLLKRTEDIKGGSNDKKKDNMLNIVTDGRKAALDIRLLDERLPDVPESKVNDCVNRVFSIYKRDDERNSLQVIWCDYSSPKSGGEFNLYDDIKNKLIQKGVPANQVAFIHDAKSELQLEKLYEKARTGMIRVLIASTGKMGVGANVQKRLAAQHHLDPPWRPADLEQRDGRMLRQGNLYHKWDIPVESYRYASKGSFDAYMWQTLETKAKFIASVMTGRAETRNIDELDNLSMNYAEMKAASAGNPKIMELVSLEADVAKLYALKNNHQRQQWNAKNNVKEFNRKIDYINQKLPDMAKDVQAYEQAVEAAGNNIDITIDGRHYTDAKDAGKALTEVLAAYKGDDIEQIGSYYGFEFYISKAANREFYGYLDLHTRHILELGTSGSGNLVRMKNTMTKLAGNLAEQESLIPVYAKRAAEFEKAANIPFDQKKELDEKSDRLAKLKLELAMDNENGDKQQKTIVNVPSRDTVISEMLDMAKLNGDFQGPANIVPDDLVSQLSSSKLNTARLAKAFGVSLNKVSETDQQGVYAVNLPNGKAITVSNASLVAGPGGQQNYRGVWNNLPGSITLDDGRIINFDGMIKLSSYYATDDTLSHEQFHAAMDIALSDKEKRIVLKRFDGDSEKAAETYGRWAAMQDKKGYPYFKKIRDFFRRIWTAITGNPNIGDIFNKVYSGRVWQHTNNSEKGRHEQYQPPKGRDPKKMVGKGPEGVANRYVQKLGKTWGKKHKQSPEKTRQQQIDANRNYEGKKSAKQLFAENRKSAMKKAFSVYGKIEKVLEPAKQVQRTFGDEAYSEIIKMAAASEAGQLEYGFTELDNAEMTFKELADAIDRLPADQKRYIAHYRGKANTPGGKHLQDKARKNIWPLAKEYARYLQQLYDKAFNLLESLDFVDAMYRKEYFYGAYTEPDRAEELLSKYYPTTQRMIKTKKIPTVADANALGLKLEDDNLAHNAFREVGAINRLAAMVRLRDYLLENHYENGIVRTGDANNYHLRKWKKLYLKGDSSTFEPIFKGLMLHPDLYEPIAQLNSVNMTSKGWLKMFRSIVHFFNGIKFMWAMHHFKTIMFQAAVDTGGWGGMLKPSTYSKILFNKYKITKEIERSERYRKYVSLGGGHTSSLEIESRQVFNRWIHSELKLHKAWLQIPARGVDKILGRFNRWTFEKFIPAVKYHKFSDEVDMLTEKLGREPTDAEMIEIIKVGQNFYGEMNEKIFGRSPTTTSFMRFVCLAPGFREGNFRTMLRALDAVAGNKLTKSPLGRDIRSLRNIPLFLILSMTIAQIGSLIMSGEMPDEPEEGEHPEEWLRDLFKINTGRKDNKGRPIMIDIMTTDKDYFHQLVQPFIELVTGRPLESLQSFFGYLVKTAGGMTSIPRSVINDFDAMFQGKVLVDWKGERVWYASDNPISKAVKFMIHEAKYLEPIPISAGRRMHEKGLNALEILIYSGTASRVTGSELEKRRSSLWQKFFDMRDRRTELRKIAKNGNLKQHDINDFNSYVDDALAVKALPVDLRDYLERLHLPDLDELLGSIDDYDKRNLKKKVKNLKSTGKTTEAVRLISIYNKEHPYNRVTLGKLLRT